MGEQTPLTRRRQRSRFERIARQDPISVLSPSPDPSPVPSYWSASARLPTSPCPPLSGEASCEVAILGAGYTGLSAALHLARGHGIDTRVLEAMEPGWGASGRNGGFCCMGAAKLPWPAMIRRHGLGDTRRYLACQQAAVALVRETIQREGLEVNISGEGEMTLAHRPNRVATLAEEQRFLSEVLGLETTLLTREALAERGMAGPGFHAGLHNPTGFGLHPLDYARGLAMAAHHHGARIHGHSPVIGWETEGNRHRLYTPRGSLLARRVIVASNAYTPEALHPRLYGRLLPALSNILVTRPLSEAERADQGWSSPQMAFDSRELLHYFRLLPDNRFLFGGRGGISTSAGAQRRMRRRLQRSFWRLFPAWREVTVEYFWSGHVALARDLVPHVGRQSDDATVLHALAYHGNGVAMASWSGRAVAGLVVGDAGVERELPALVRRPPPRFPLAGLRNVYLRAAYLGVWLRDEWF